MSKSSKRTDVRSEGGPAPLRPTPLRAAQQGRVLETARPRAEVKAGKAGSGYSGTPLARKLGVRPNERLAALNAPENYAALLPGLPEGVKLVNRLTARARFVHLFVKERLELRRRLRELREKIDAAGILWISWPKKASKVPTDITEDVIRAEALPLGFVDVKVCAVDETWSGLKLMIRRENRKSAK